MLFLLLFLTLPTTIEGFATPFMHRAFLTQAPSHLDSGGHTTLLPDTSLDSASDEYENKSGNEENMVRLVLVTGFESFNRDLYEKAGALLPPECRIHLDGS
jgi:hypothetical protein